MLIAGNGDASVCSRGLLRVVVGHGWCRVNHPCLDRKYKNASSLGWPSGNEVICHSIVSTYHTRRRVISTQVQRVRAVPSASGRKDSRSAANRTLARESTRPGVQRALTRRDPEGRDASHANDTPKPHLTIACGCSPSAPRGRPPAHRAQEQIAPSRARLQRNDGRMHRSDHPRCAHA